MKVPCCSVCQTRYNEEDRVPLLLQCGHGFCKECLSKMFSGSTDATLPCPRCRHVSLVGNSVQALRKNYAVLALLPSNSSDCDFTDDDGDDDDGDYNDDGDEVERCRRRHVVSSSSSSSCGRVIDVGAHPEVKLVRKIGEGKRVGVEIWAALISNPSASSKCKHRLAVKRVDVGEDMQVEWVLGQLESLRRTSIWCRNVCSFHGVVKMDSCLGLVMDRCYGSVQSEMQQNEGRLTLEQILRLIYYSSCLPCSFWFFDALYRKSYYSLCIVHASCCMGRCDTSVIDVVVTK